MKKNIKKMNKKNETKSKEVVLRSIRMKTLSPLEMFLAIYSRLNNLNEDVSFVKVFKNVIGIDAVMTERAYYLDTKDDEQFKIYEGMDAYYSNTGKDKYYYPEDIYYATSANDILTYSGLRRYNINYNNEIYMYPTNSLVIVIKESDYDSSKNKSFNIERIGQEVQGGFKVDINRITIQNNIMEEPNKYCNQGSYYNSSNCNRFLENSKNVKNIIFISKSPIQSKYASSIDGLLQV